MHFVKRVACTWVTFEVHQSVVGFRQEIVVTAELSGNSSNSQCVCAAIAWAVDDQNLMMNVIL